VLTEPVVASLHVRIALDEVGMGLVDPQQPPVFVAGSLAFLSDTARAAATEDAARRKLVKVGEGVPTHKRGSKKEQAAFTQLLDWIGANSVRPFVTLVRTDDPRVRSWIASYPSLMGKTDGGIIAPMRHISNAPKNLWANVIPLTIFLQMAMLVTDGQQVSAAEIDLDDMKLDDRSKEVLEAHLVRHCEGGRAARILTKFGLRPDQMPTRRSDLTLRFGDEQLTPVLQLSHRLCTLAIRHLTPAATSTTIGDLRAKLGHWSVNDFTDHIGGNNL
jgi:hypothetical protein